MDSGASEHMTSLQIQQNVRPTLSGFKIALPIGDTSIITHIGDVVLVNGLKLFNVLYVPKFKYNLLSIHKIVKDNNCLVQYCSAKCLISCSQTKRVIAVVS